MDVVAINGIALDPPHALTDEECDELAAYNTARGRGVLYTDETVERMAQLQLRFDWLGYFTSDGQGHNGPRTSPPVVNVRPERVFWLSRI